MILARLVGAVTPPGDAPVHVWITDLGPDHDAPHREAGARVPDRAVERRRHLQGHVKRSRDLVREVGWYGDNIGRGIAVGTTIVGHDPGRPGIRHEPHPKVASGQVQIKVAVGLGPGYPVAVLVHGEHTHTLDGRGAVTLIDRTVEPAQGCYIDINTRLDLALF